jgi:Tn3 transposase DDE domain
VEWDGRLYNPYSQISLELTEDHELSMLALHLLQNCMVYINTLMMQQVLARPQWAERLTPTDLRALTPLIWEHVNPYGRFELNMETRLDLNPNGPW